LEKRDFEHMTDDDRRAFRDRVIEPSWVITKPRKDEDTKNGVILGMASTRDRSSFGVSFFRDFVIPFVDGCYRGKKMKVTQRKGRSAA
jgi:hypothetical protein